MRWRESPGKFQERKEKEMQDEREKKNNFEPTEQVAQSKKKKETTE